jgi:DNA-binding NtrC family response regulator
MSGDVTDPRGRRLPTVEELETVARPLEASEEVSTALRLIVTEGPDAGKSFLLDPNMPSRLLVGTGPACEMKLSDPTVSRRHAGIEPAGRRFKLTDFGSTNGTFVDGVAVVEAFVRGGETLRLGSTAMQVEPAARAADAPPLPSAMRFGRVVGASTAMRRLYPLCERLARARVPVVIEGETGTGKENLAESLHEASGVEGPFVVFDCTTVSPSLVEAELFGHEKGAFTGAVASRTGFFEQADGGTLFIDEIGDLDLPLQSKLLRALDRGEIRRVGGNKQINVNVRILAATRRDLDKEVAAGRFRDDLFHRLTVARIELPPLRERHGDIPLLARHFCQQMGAPPDVLSPSIMARFESSAWPGNVRELRNAVARVIALGEEEGLLGSLAGKSQTMPPPSSRTGGAGDWLEALCNGGMPFPLARRRALEEFERRYVQNVLAQHDGNVARAAQASGIALRYFQLVKARGKKAGG